MAIYRRHSSKPIQGTALDRSHGLARGLVGFYAINEGSGPNVLDSAGGLALATTGFGSTNPWGAGSTVGLLCTTSTAGALASLPASLQLGWPISFATGFRPVGGATLPTYFGALANSTAASPYFGWGLSCNSAVIDVKWNSGGTQETLATSYTPTTGVDTVLSSTLTATGQVVYAQGNPIATGATASANPSYSGTAQLAIGLETGTTGRQINAVVYWCAWWSRALSAGEHAELARNPWQLFAPAADALYVPSAPAAAGGGAALLMGP